MLMHEINLQKDRERSTGGETDRARDKEMMHIIVKMIHNVPIIPLFLISHFYP